MTFNYEATGMGSLPHRDSKTASRIVLDNFRNIPFWPQLPRRSFLENMYAQFSERMPGLVVDEDKKTIHIDTSKVARQIEEVYQRYLDADLEYFRISEDRAEGLYAFLESLANPHGDAKYLKGQITGPVSFALSLTDQNKRAVIYDKDLFEVLTKVLSMKARWQIKKLKERLENVIIFIDEPYLASIGSSYININIEESMKKLDELVDSIKKDGGIAGIHCCGNTDWPLLLRRDIDILSFDAYTFMKEFSLYSADIKNFLAKGGAIAWGIVPSSDAADAETKKGLVERLKADIKILTDKGIDNDAISSLVTPSCGLGTLAEEKAERILKLTRKISDYF